MSILKALGYGALALSFVADLGKKRDAAAPPSGRRGIGLGDTGKAGKQGAPRVREVDVKTIDQRVALIRGRICEGSKSGEIDTIGSDILSKKCRKADGSQVFCAPEKNSLAETLAFFKAIRDPNSKYAVRYTSDNSFADVFTSARRTLGKKHTGDCDDFVVTLGSLLVWAGHPIKIRVIQTKDKRSWSHVYLLTLKNHFDANSPWIAVDGSVNKPLGWEAPGASDVARTGKPSGITVKVRDFPVVCKGAK